MLEKASINCHLYAMATFVAADNPYIHSYFNLLTKATSPQKQQPLKSVPNYQSNLST